jgi:hypothetical protein
MQPVLRDGERRDIRPRLSNYSHGLAVTSDALREARAACERAFSFLVSDFDYRKVRGRFRWGGFELGYCGQVLGVLVEWYPRDPLTVWLVILEDGDFPPRDVVVAGGGPLRYFDLGDVEIIKTGRRAVDERQLYGLPTERTAGVLSDSLRQYASELLRGELGEIPRLERRIRDRVAAAAAARGAGPQ